MNTHDGNNEIVYAALRRMNLAEEGEIVAIESLGGGVSCDVWRVRLRSGDDLVVKRALDALRVEAEWHAPVERSATEVAWMRLVAKLNPRWVPQVIAEDRSQHLFVMPYLPVENYPLWKAQLARGQISSDFANQVGEALARIHAATAGSETVARAFSHDDQFMALRLEPYLLFTAFRHPEVAGRITALANDVARARIALMQGDISPKNILSGPDGPVFLDAETACYGDPAFDLAFCLNHLLLKAVWHPEYMQSYCASFDSLKCAYLAEVDWEDAEDIDRRTAALLPALLLARVDGKSPVEYLTDVPARDFVRQTALSTLKSAPQRLDEVLGTWVERVTYFAGSR